VGALGEFYLAILKVCIKLRYSSSFFLVFNYFVFILASSPFILIPLHQTLIIFFWPCNLYLDPSLSLPLSSHSCLVRFFKECLFKNTCRRGMAIIIKRNAFFYHFLRRIKLIQERVFIINKHIKIVHKIIFSCI